MKYISANTSAKPPSTTMRQGTAARVLGLGPSAFLPPLAALNRAMNLDANIAVCMRPVSTSLVTRRRWPRFAVWAALLLTACGAPSPRPMPAAAGAWSRSAETPQDVDAPAVLRELGLKSARLYRYNGPVAIELRVFEMSSPTVAFEGMQRWQVRPGTLPFTVGAFLFEPSVPQAPDGAKASLEAFVTAFRAAF